jgi:hypothetical protein
LKLLCSDGDAADLNCGNDGILVDTMEDGDAVAKAGACAGSIKGFGCANANGPHGVIVGDYRHCRGAVKCRHLEAALRLASDKNLSLSLN